MFWGVFIFLEFGVGVCFNLGILLFCLICFDIFFIDCLEGVCFFIYWLKFNKL